MWLLTVFYIGFWSSFFFDMYRKLSLNHMWCVNTLTRGRTFEQVRYVLLLNKINIYQYFCCCDLFTLGLSGFYLQLEDGDIICFQKSPRPENEDQYQYPSVPSFLQYVRNRQVLIFLPYTIAHSPQGCCFHFSGWVVMF